MSSNLQNLIFSINSPEEFEKLSIDIFRYQAENNPVYKAYIENLRRDPGKIRSICEIPFLPIGFFRNHKIITGSKEAEVIFESSRTTGQEASRHYIADLKLYERSFIEGFKFFFGLPEDFFFAALLPSYLERKNSSLVYMADKLIKGSNDNRSSFFLFDTDSLVKILEEVKRENRKAMLIGVSFALLDLAEKVNPDLSGIMVVETGGMKGRRKELTRMELHSVLKERFNIKTVYSEYGMTELLSQAWSTGEGRFQCPPWMKILLREINDPLSVSVSTGVTGGVNIIDLANFHSCSFIATGDLGKLHDDGSFEISGRFDNSDIRGCNLMIQ